MTREQMVEKLKTMGYDGRKLRHMSDAAMAEIISPPGAALKPPPQAEPKPSIDPEVAKLFVAEGRKKLAAMRDHYSPFEPEPIPDRVDDHLRRIFFATSHDEARNIQRRALEKLEFHLLALWGNKKISGPLTERNGKKLYDAQMSWATRMQEMGRSEEDVNAQIAKAKATLAQFTQDAA